MSGKKPENQKIRGLNSDYVEQPEIFGRSRSREEIREDIKAERAAEREKIRQQRRTEREQRRTERRSGTGRRDTWITVGVLGLIVVACGGLLAWQIYTDTKNEEYEKSDTNTAEFLDDSAQPELSEDGLTAAVNQVYYTKGGYLCVRMTLGNGSDKPQHMSSLLVKLLNTESEEQIASGYTENISKKYTVPAGGFNEYTFYISPEFVSLKDDPLSGITYEITCEGYLEEDASDTSNQ